MALLAIMGHDAGGFEGSFREAGVSVSRPFNTVGHYFLLHSLATLSFPLERTRLGISTEVHGSQRPYCARYRAPKLTGLRMSTDKRTHLRRSFKLMASESFSLPRRCLAILGQRRPTKHRSPVCKGGKAAQREAEAGGWHGCAYAPLALLQCIQNDPVIEKMLRP